MVNVRPPCGIPTFSNLSCCMEKEHLYGFPLLLSMHNGFSWTCIDTPWKNNGYAA